MDSSSLVAGLIAGSIVGICIAAIVVYVLLVIADWKIFTKAGEAGWKSIIPIYNIYITYKICWKKSMFWVMLLVDIVANCFLAAYESNGSVVCGLIAIVLLIATAVISIMQYYKLAKAFGHGVGYTLGLIFIPNIMTLILGFGSDEYQGPQ